MFWAKKPLPTFEMSIFAPNWQFESKILMNQGRYIFSQLCDFLPTDHFKWLVKKYIMMLQQVAEGDKTKTVYLPYEATNLMGSIGGIKDLFKE